MKKSIALLMVWLVALCGILAGCGSGGGSDPAAPTNYSVSGMVVDGPIANAACSVYKVTAAGAKGDKVAGPVTTSVTGAYTATTTYAGPVIVECSGGSFIDWATGQTKNLTTSDLISAVASTAGGSATVDVTPLTHMAAAMALAEIASGDPIASAITEANGRIGQYFGLNDILATLPIDPTVAGSGATATQGQKDYALILAGISKYAADNSITNPLDLVEKLAEDAKDGKFDGKDGSTQLTVGAGDLAATAMSTDLAAAITAFQADGSRNLSGIDISTEAETLIQGATGTMLQMMGAVSMSPTTRTLTTAGETFTAGAKGLTLSGAAMDPQPAFTFTSSAPSVATVDPVTGVVTAVANGIATITASARGKTGTCVVTVAIVTAPVVASINVTPSSKTLTTAGETFTVTATALDASNNPLSPQPTITWSSTNPSVATVTEAGVVTAVANGSAAIEARVGNKMSDCNVTVDIQGGGGGGSGTAAEFFTKRAVGNHWTLIQTTSMTGLPTTTQTQTITITATDSNGYDYNRTGDNAGTGRMALDGSGNLVDTSGGGSQMALPATFTVGTQYVMVPASSGQGAMNATIAAFNQTRTVPAGTFTDCIRIDYTKSNEGGVLVTASVYWSNTAGYMVEQVATVTAPSMTVNITTQLQAGYLANP